VARTYTSKSGT